MNRPRIEPSDSQQGHVARGSSRAESPTPSFLTEEVGAAETSLSNALRIEKHIRQLLKEYQHYELLTQWHASRRIVERTAEDYAAATHRLIDDAAKQLSQASESRAALLAFLARRTPAKPPRPTKRHPSG
jgi:cell wall-associated NlpC family hydrolase